MIDEIRDWKKPLWKLKYDPEENQFYGENVSDMRRRDLNYGDEIKIFLANGTQFPWKTFVEK